MAKIRSTEVVATALELLNEIGLDAFTTRRLAERLGVESATLYWHFRDKAALLDSMAATGLAKHHLVETPLEIDRWLEWFADNARSFRRALLAYRDGARLHAGTTPSRQDLVRLAPKVAYLVRVGFTEREALMALLTASQFTIGCVLEEQARAQPAGPDALPAIRSEEKIQGVEGLTAHVAEVTAANNQAAFEFGLSLILDGLCHRIQTDASTAASMKKPRRSRLVNEGK